MSQKGFSSLQVLHDVANTRLKSLFLSTKYSNFSAEISNWFFNITRVASKTASWKSFVKIAFSASVSFPLLSIKTKGPFAESLSELRR